jgi:hypothetical protein
MPVFGRCPETQCPDDGSVLEATAGGSTGRTSELCNKRTIAVQQQRLRCRPLNLPPRPRLLGWLRITMQHSGSVLPQKPLALPAMARCTWFARRPRWGAKQRSPVSAAGFFVSQTPGWMRTNVSDQPVRQAATSGAESRRKAAAPRRGEATGKPSLSLSISWRLCSTTLPNEAHHIAAVRFRDRLRTTLNSHRPRLTDKARCLAVAPLPCSNRTHRGPTTVRTGLAKCSRDQQALQTHAAACLTPLLPCFLLA